MFYELWKLTLYVCIRISTSYFGPCFLGEGFCRKCPVTTQGFILGSSGGQRGK